MADIKKKNSPTPPQFPNDFTNQEYVYELVESEVAILEKDKANKIVEESTLVDLNEFREGNVIPANSPNQEVTWYINTGATVTGTGTITIANEGEDVLNVLDFSPSLVTLSYSNGDEIITLYEDGEWLVTDFDLTLYIGYENHVLEKTGDSVDGGLFTAEVSKINDLVDIRLELQAEIDNIEQILNQADTTKANKIVEAGAKVDFSTLVRRDEVLKGLWRFSKGATPTTTDVVEISDGQGSPANVLRYSPEEVSFSVNGGPPVIYYNGDWLNLNIDLAESFLGHVSITAKAGEIDLDVLTKTPEVYKDLSDVKSELETAIGLKVNTADIVDDLTSEAADVPLSAAQGKVLDTNKVNIADIVDALDSEVTDVPLSANQGRLLNNKITTLSQQGQDRGTVRCALTSLGQTFRLTSVSAQNHGTDYVVGDALFIPSDSDEINAILIVDRIDGSGQIDEISISKPGDYKTDKSGTPVAVFTSGIGSNATVIPTFTLEPASKLSDLPSPQPNDRALVITDEVHNNESWWWIYADYNGDGTYNWVPLAPNSITTYTKSEIDNKLAEYARLAAENTFTEIQNFQKGARYAPPA